MNISKYLFGGLALAACVAFTACDDDDVVINTTPIVSEVTTVTADVSATAATLYGAVADLSSQNATAYSVGFVYGTQDNPTVTGARTNTATYADGTITAAITGLTPGQTYYYATFVTLQGKMTYYGEVKSFYTTDAPVGTPEPSAIEATRATLGGTITTTAEMNGDYGVALSANADINAANVKYSALVGRAGEATTNTFNITVDALVPNTTYYCAAYNVINGQYVYGNVQQFTTAASAAQADQESAGQYVTMGTKAEWCAYNVGATKPSEVGTLIGYGDRAGLNRSINTEDYATYDIADSGNDAAKTSNMGRIPTQADWEELIAACTIAEAELDGVQGLQFTSKSTGNTLFFPYGGSRQGESVIPGVGAYWTGTFDGTPGNNEYAACYVLNGNGAAKSVALNYTGMCIRPVRTPYTNEIKVDNSKLVYGDLENNGRLRVEIYNMYGATGSNPPINPALLAYNNLMEVTFTITGINDNLKDGAKGSYKAGLQYADEDWYPSYWSGYTNSKYDAVVSGDGTYTVWYYTPDAAAGAAVFCIDIDGLGADLADMDKVKVAIDGIALDSKQPKLKDVAVQAASGAFGNKDGNGVDGRVEVYNEYGATSGLADYSGMVAGPGLMTVTFTIKGIDGNLKADAAGAYSTELSYASADWSVSYWGGLSAAGTTITGDGTYSVQAPVYGTGVGAVVWTIEVYGLWQDLVNTEGVTATIDEITVPSAE